MRSPRTLRGLCPESIGLFWAERGVSRTVKNMSPLSIDGPGEGIFVTNCRTVSSFGFLCFGFSSSPCAVFGSGALRRQECFNTSPSSPCRQPQSSPVDVSFLFHPQIWGDENFGHFTWPRAIDNDEIGGQMDLHFFLKTKHSLSLLRSYLFNEQKQYN